MPSTLLSAAQIREAIDLKEETVEVPEWGGSVRMVQMTAAESMEMTKLTHQKEYEDAGIYLILIFTAKDEAGNRLLTVEDVVALQKKNFNVLNRLQHVAISLNRNGIAEQAVLKKD